MKPALLTAAILFSASAAVARTPGVQGVFNTLRAQGYSDIEVGRPHSGKITIEAHRQGAERELIYDAQTGRLLSDRSHASAHPADAGHDFEPEPQRRKQRWSRLLRRPQRDRYRPGRRPQRH